MSFYNSAIAALFPLLLAISAPQPNISANSAIAQSTSPATTSQPSAIAKSWDSARLVHTIPDNRNTGVFAFSNDGQMLATEGKRFETSADGKSITETSDNIIKLWNINTGKQVGSLIYYSPSSPVKAIAFSPNNQIIATISDNLVIKLWNVTTQQEIQTFRSIVKPKIHPELNNSVDESAKIAFTPDGKTLISITGGNSTIQLWDVASIATAKSTLKNIKPQTSLQAETRYSDGVSHLNTLISLQPTEIEQAVRQDSNRYIDYVAKDQNTIKIRLDAGDSLETIKNNLKQSSLLVQQWRKTESPATYQAKTNYYIDDLISRITKEYIYLNARYVVEQLGTPTAEGSRIFAGQGYTLTDQGNNFTVIANLDQRVILRMQNGQLDRSLNTSNQDITDFRAAVQKLLNQGSPRTLTGHTNEITAFTFSPDSQILITGSKDKTIKQWNLKTGRLIRTLNKHSGEITSFAISKDSQVIASGSKDKTIKLWNIKTGQLIRTLSNKGEIYTVKFSLDGKTLIATSALQPNSVESHLQLWNVSNGKLIRDSGLNWRTQLAINPDGKTYAIAGNALSLQILNLSTGKLIKNFGIEQQSAIFTPDGQTLVTFSDQGIKIWQ